MSVGHDISVAEEVSGLHPSYRGLQTTMGGSLRGDASRVVSECGGHGTPSLGRQASSGELLPLFRP